MTAPVKLPATVPAPTMLDRAIMAVTPEYGARRYRARVAVAMLGQYSGAKSKKAALKAWHTLAGSADADTLGDLPTLRARSRDLRRNTPIATGAANTSRVHTVGTGLRVRSTIDRETLGLSEEQAEAWERRTEKLFHLWASSKAVDVTMHQNFYQLQGLVFDAVFESGDCLVLRRRAKTAAVAPLALAVIEADRIATPYEFLTDADARPIAPNPALVARLRPDAANVSTRGDTSYAPTFHIHGAHDPAHVQRQVETKFFDMIRQCESEQRGLLSD